MPTTTEPRPCTRRHARRVLIMTIVAAAMLLLSPNAQAAPGVVSVAWNSNGVNFEATSTKDIGNVIVMDCQQETHKEDGLSGKKYNYTHVNTIVGVWVKSGNNHDPQGPPGAGEWFANPYAQCEIRPPPCLPDELAVVAQPGPNNHLTWDSVGSADSYNVYRSVGVGPFVWIANVPAGTTHYDDGAVAAGTMYRYAVTTIDDNEESQPCDYVEVVTIPVFPTALVTVGAAGVGVASYALLRRRS